MSKEVERPARGVARKLTYLVPRMPPLSGGCTSSAPTPNVVWCYVKSVWSMCRARLTGGASLTHIAHVVVYISFGLTIAGCEKMANSSVVLGQVESAPRRSPQYERCAGLADSTDCRRIEERLAAETPDQAAARVAKLEADRKASMDQVAVQIIVPERTKEWHVQGQGSRCIRSQSPAEAIRLIRDSGGVALITDLPGGAVKVGYDDAGTTYYRVFYPSEGGCMANFPGLQIVPDKYE
jgi:hypothetical protein